MSTTLFVTVKYHNESICCQTLVFDKHTDAVDAKYRLYEDYKESCSLSVKVTILEGTA
jgi:hypothetical protein